MFPLPALNSLFRLSVITDEITQDLGHALDVASKEFGPSFELRTVWNKNIINLDEKEISEVQRYRSNTRSPHDKAGWECRNG